MLFPVTSADFGPPSYVALQEWKRRLTHGLSQVDDSLTSDIPEGAGFNIKFAGYVAKQYIQKTSQGEKRAVAAYEAIMRRIPKSIRSNFVAKLQHESPEISYEVGRIPNL